MSDLVASLKAISERNQKTRAAFTKMTARVTEITLSGTMDDLNEFNSQLEAELDRLLEPQGEDSATGGTDSGGRDESIGGGESAQ